VVVIAAVLYAAISLLFQTVRVDGTSMVPTLQTQDFLLATKFSYHLHDPARGDIIVLQPPNAQDANRDFIKRIIGMPGDLLQIDGNYADPRTRSTPSTAILIKPGGRGPWQRLAETYLPAGPNDAWTVANFCCQSAGSTLLVAPDNTPHPITIPADRYFVLGDNRNESKDSRFIGLIPKQNIIAKASVRLFPLGHTGTLGNGPTLVPAPGMAGALPALLWPARRRWRSARPSTPKS
jgi:signal peptidase I